MVLGEKDGTVRLHCSLFFEWGRDARDVPVSPSLRKEPFVTPPTEDSAAAARRQVQEAFRQRMEERVARTWHQESMRSASRKIKMKLIRALFRDPSFDSDDPPDQGQADQDQETST